MPTEGALLPTMAVICSSATEPRRTRHRPSLDHSVDTDMLVPDLQYPVHHHCLKRKEGVNVVYNGLQRFFDTSSLKINTTMLIPVDAKIRTIKNA